MSITNITTEAVVASEMTNSSSDSQPTPIRVECSSETTPASISRRTSKVRSWAVQAIKRVTSVVNSEKVDASADVKATDSNSPADKGYVECIM
jgi:hypothetical protein